MASTKEMQARAKAKKMEQSRAEFDIKYGNDPAVLWFVKVKVILNAKSDWKVGYEATDQAAHLVDALITRQRTQGTKEDFDTLINSLVNFRFELEGVSRKRLKLDNDALRYSTKSNDELKYVLGLLDLLIGSAVMQGKIVTHITL